MESDGGREDGWRVWRLQEIAFDGVVGQPKAAAQGAEWVPAKDHHVSGEDQSCRGSGARFLLYNERVDRMRTFV